MDCRSASQRSGTDAKRRCIGAAFSASAVRVVCNHCGMAAGRPAASSARGFCLGNIAGLVKPGLCAFAGRRATGPGLAAAVAPFWINRGDRHLGVCIPPAHLAAGRQGNRRRPVHRFRNRGASGIGFRPRHRPDLGVAGLQRERLIAFAVLACSPACRGSLDRDCRVRVGSVHDSQQFRGEIPAVLACGRRLTCRRCNDDPGPAIAASDAAEPCRPGRVRA